MLFGGISSHKAKLDVYFALWSFTTNNAFIAESTVVAEHGETVRLTATAASSKKGGLPVYCLTTAHVAGDASTAVIRTVFTPWKADILALMETKNTLATWMLGPEAAKKTKGPWMRLGKGTVPTLLALAEQDWAPTWESPSGEMMLFSEVAATVELGVEHDGPIDADELSAILDDPNGSARKGLASTGTFTMAGSADTGFMLHILPALIEAPASTEFLAATIAWQFTGCLQSLVASPESARIGVSVLEQSVRAVETAVKDGLQ